MAYSTPAMVGKALVATSDGSVPDPMTYTAADLADAQLADFIAEADSTIDGYLTRFYTTPVVGSPTPHPIDYWSRNIAAYNATLSYRGSQDLADADPVVRRYNATMEALKAVSAGTVGLALPAQTGDVNAAGADAPFNPYAGTLFCIEDFDVNPPSWSWPAGPYWR